MESVDLNKLKEHIDSIDCVCSELIQSMHDILTYANEHKNRMSEDDVRCAKYVMKKLIESYQCLKSTIYELQRTMANISDSMNEGV